MTSEVRQADVWEHEWQETVDAQERAARDAHEDWALVAEFGSMCGKARTTQHKYERCVADFSAFLTRFHDAPALVEADRAHVVKFLAWLDGNNRGALPLHQVGETTRQLSASTRKGYLSALRAFYHYCLDMEYVHYDPTAGIRAPKVEHKPGLTLTADELTRFLDAPGSERDRIQAYLFVFTAQRAGAIRSLRWRDVSLDQQELTFLDTKGGKPSVIYMHHELLGALARWRAVVKTEEKTNPRIAAAMADEETAFVLLTRNGRRVTVQTLGKQVKWRAARAGLRLHKSDDVYRENKSQVHPHAFRRSWATVQRRAGVPIEDIADALGHASTDTTRKHYAFPASETVRRTMKSFTLR